MEFNFEALKQELLDKKAVPMVIIYAVPGEGGTDLDFLTTPVYDKAEPQLKRDVTKVIGMTFDQMKG